MLTKIFFWLRLYFPRFMVVKLVCVSTYTSSSGINKKIIMLFHLWISLSLSSIFCSWYLDIWHVGFFICDSATSCSHCCFYWMHQLIADPHRRLILKKSLWCLISKRCLVKWVITWQKVCFNVWKNFWRNVILDPWIRCSGCKCYSSCTCSISCRRSISMVFCFIKATN